MAKSLDDMLAQRPANRKKVDAHKQRMRSQVRAYKLKELRKELLLSQVQVADRLGVGQNRISNIERGDLDRVRLDTLKRYVDAVGGSLRIEVEVGDNRYQIV